MIDLRSDTVTRPSPGMRAAIADAVVGDDVWGDDPTVHALEARAAEVLGKDAAVFVPSGTQSNLCALLAHCRRGDEYIVGANAHTYRYEGGGAAVLGSIQPQPVGTTPTGMLDLDQVAAVVKPDDHHFARSTLLCLENTSDGRVQSLDELAEAKAVADGLGLAFHLDGARLWNAAVALGVSPAAVAAPFDTVSVCLSKGLGAPMGSVLVGRPDLIAEARKWRKMLGGGMRQAGMMAAGGLYAIDNNIDRLADDHANAERLAAGLADVDGVTVGGHATNMVFLTIDGDDAANQQALADQGILARIQGGASRLVTHLDIADDDIATTVAAFASLAA